MWTVKAYFKMENILIIFVLLVAIVSLPHEIQRNLTMIREHDSRVQGKKRTLKRLF